MEDFELETSEEEYTYELIPQEIGYGPGWKWASIILGILFLLGGLVVMALPWTGLVELKYPALAYAYVAGGLALLVLAYALFWEANKGRVIITEDSVISRMVFFTRQLRFEEIKGYRVGENYFRLEPWDKEKKTVLIAKHIYNLNEVNAATGYQLRNLEHIEAQEELNEIIQNEALGADGEERFDRLVQAKRLATLINGVGFVSALVFLFYPKPYALWFIAATILPVIAILVTKLYVGYIKFDSKEESVYPHLTYAIAMPGPALLVRALMEYNILVYDKLIVHTAGIAVLITIIAVVLFPDLREKKGKTVFHIIMAFLLSWSYTFGVGTISNCYYDDAPVKEYIGIVADKEIRGGRKSKTPYLILEKNPLPYPMDDIKVSRDEYNRINPGDTVKLYLKPGDFGAPWFYSEKE